MGEVIHKNIKLLPSQYKFLHSTKKEVLFSGAYAAGKSLALCYALLKQSTIKNNTVLLLRKTLTSLKRSTLESLIGGVNPVLPSNSYTFLKSEGKIMLNGGGSIYILGVDDPVRIRSINAGCIGIDEATEFTNNEYSELLGRLRGQEGSRQIFLATNPASPTHWIYRRFFLEKNFERDVILAKTTENIYLPKDYIDNLKELPLHLYRRFVEGRWESNSEWGIYQNFDRDKNCKKLDMELSYEDYIIGVDMGFTHPAAILLVGKMGDRLFVLKEWRKSKQLMEDICKVVHSFCENLPIKPTIVVDPSAPTLIAQLQSEGLNAIKANNDVAGGITRVRNKFEIRGDSPDLMINEYCTQLISEIECYSYDAETEKPVKVNDDLLDGLRYVCAYVDDQYTEYEKPLLITDDTEDTEDTEDNEE